MGAAAGVARRGPGPRRRRAAADPPGTPAPRPRATASHLRDDRGQGAVELLAMLPLLAAVALATAQLLAAGIAQSAAAQAAQAAAMAIVQDTGEPEAAARDAARAWSRKDLRVRVRGREVTVTIRPPALVPGTAHLLRATATADAGPTP